MTKNLQSDSVGDSKAPPLKPQEFGLRSAVDQACTMVADSSPALKVQSATASLRSAVQKPASPSSPTSCQQRPWLSFFFDGTGNNLDADVGTAKHSNVAKLFRVHADDDMVNGIYRIYIPGVGTYFRDVGDDGGGMLGLVGGHMGDVGLDWALAQFDKRLSGHLARASSPGNAIIEINVALFGFSRGAALARAFANMLLEERCIATKAGWCLKQGSYRFRIRFMGLFDTVASVGAAMSSNTVSKVALVFRDVKPLITARLFHGDYIKTRPQSLAFSKGAVPGADPAPGTYNGHQDWGGDMAIPHMVEHVRHFVAAHEIRNSFPVDSVSTLRDGKISKPEHFHETVFPGVHSDVGGSYRPGEGGRSSDFRARLGLIPLHSMYQYAVEHKVPLHGKMAWRDFNKRDFEISETLLEQYNYYQSKVKGISNLGPLMNAHMALYYAWRFRSIRLKQQGSRDEANEIQKAHKTFSADRISLDKQIAALEQDNAAATRALTDARSRRIAYIQSNYGNPNLPELSKYDVGLRAAQDHQERVEDSLLRATAKRDALPDMTDFSSLIDLYDAQLIADVKAIREEYTERGMFGGAPDSGRRKDLRPHYKVLVEAYENEFIHKKGLTDKTIVAFFDNYVHDSLAGFAKDATLPSDPRVIYLGGNEKYKYAAINNEQNDFGFHYASIAKPQSMNANGTTNLNDGEGTGRV